MTAPFTLDDPVPEPSLDELVTAAFEESAAPVVDTEIPAPAAEDETVPAADANPPASSDAAPSAADASDEGEPEPVEEPFDLLGTQLTREEAEQLKGLYDWATGLTPEQAAAVVQATTRPQAMPSTPQGIATDSNVGPAQSAPAANGGVAEELKIEWDADLTDPAVIRAYETMTARIAQLEAQSAVATASAAQSQQLEAERGIHAARAEIGTRYGLSDVELDVAVQRAVASQITPYVRQQPRRVDIAGPIVELLANIEIGRAHV